MRKKKGWRCLMALVLSITMLVPAQAAYAAGGQAEESGLDVHADGRAADADGFEIEDGGVEEVYRDSYGSGDTGRGDKH